MHFYINYVVFKHETNIDRKIIYSYLRSDGNDTLEDAENTLRGVIEEDGETPPNMFYSIVACYVGSETKYPYTGNEVLLDNSSNL